MSIEIEDLDHLGLVAGFIDDIGIVEIIDEIVGREKTELVSVGQAVKGMILNGLGLISAPLYLFSPLWMKVGSGNSSDTQQFGEILQEFKKQMDWESLFVTDSAFYSRDLLKLRWNRTTLAPSRKRKKTGIGLKEAR